MRLTRRTFVIIVLFLVMGGIIFYRSRVANSQKTKIEITKVERKNLIEEVTSSGETEAKNQVDLTFQTGGRLSWVGVKEGDTVYAYQTIASLDARDLQKSLEKALRDYSKERNDFEEDKQVTYKDKVLTDTIKRILEKNQWDLEKAVLDVELQTIALQWSTIVTPIAGIVTHIDTPIAEVNVTPTDTFTVADLSSIVFSANIDEVEIGKVILGQNADIHLDAFPEKTFTGKVTKIAYSAETSSGGTSIYPVEITFSEIDALRLGLNGDVSINIAQKDNVISIPLEAVREDDQGQKYVMVKIDSKFERKNIKTGLETETDIEIVSGLAVRESVVVKGFESLAKEVNQ